MVKIYHSIYPYYSTLLYQILLMQLSDTRCIIIQTDRVWVIKCTWTEKCFCGKNGIEVSSGTFIELKTPVKLLLLIVLYSILVWVVNWFIYFAKTSALPSAWHRSNLTALFPIYTKDLGTGLSQLPFEGLVYMLWWWDFFNEKWTRTSKLTVM